MPQDPWEQALATYRAQQAAEHMQALRKRLIKRAREIQQLDRLMREHP